MRKRAQPEISITEMDFSITNDLKYIFLGWYYSIEIIFYCTQIRSRRFVCVFARETSTSGMSDNYQEMTLGKFYFNSSGFSMISFAGIASRLSLDAVSSP